MGERLFKANLQLRLKKFEKFVDEDGKIQLKLIDTIITKPGAKDVERFISKCSVEYVNEPPAQFNLNVLYIRKDGKVAWLFAEINEN